MKNSPEDDVGCEALTKWVVQVAVGYESVARC